MDHLVSAQPGLIPQMSGFLTNFNLRITRATVFVDHYSDHVFVHLTKNLTLEELYQPNLYRRDFCKLLQLLPKVIMPTMGRLQTEFSQMLAN